MKSDDVNRMVEVMTTNRLRERTRQLAEQAGFVLWYGAERRYRKKQIAIDWASNYDDELEKFVELIVRECLGICKEKEQANLYGVREVENTIKEHFGVE